MLRIFLLIIFTLFIAENVFNADVTAWLAGLGIAGLAVSLAAQDSLKNLFGSVAVLMDRPFSLGDRIIFNTIDGVVEVIGFRSTRIRTMQGNLVTVPNMKFTDGIIENLTVRPFFHRKLNVSLSPDTPPARIREAIGICEQVLNEPEITDGVDRDQRPPRITLAEITADSLVLEVLYWYSVGPQRDFWTFREHVSRVNLRLLEALRKGNPGLLAQNAPCDIRPDTPGPNFAGRFEAKS